MNEQPLSSSRLRSAAPSSSAVDWRTVAKRQCSTRRSPSKAPKWVWVLPTSTASSIGAHYARRPDARERTRSCTCVPASHPCAAVEAALELKGIDYQRVELLPLSQVLVGPLLYGGVTVPGMRVDGQRLVGSRAIMRRVDELAPEPPLLPPPGEPATPACWRPSAGAMRSSRRVPRRLIDAAFLRNPRAMESYADRRAAAAAVDAAPQPAAHRPSDGDAQQGPGRERAGRSAGAARPAGADRRLDRGRPAGRPGPNAADLQIGSTIRLLNSIGDVRPLIEAAPPRGLCRYSRRCAAKSRRGRCRRSGCPRPPRPRRACPPRRGPAARGLRRPAAPAAAPPSDALADVERGKGVGQALAVGGAQLEVELQGRDQHEAAREQLLVQERHPLVRSSVAQQQDVDVDRPWPVAAPAAAAPELALQLLDGVQQLQRLELGRTRRQAFRKLGWSSTSPTGSVS